MRMRIRFPLFSCEFEGQGKKETVHMFHTHTQSEQS